MRYQLCVEDLRQPERRWAKVMAAIGWGVGLTAVIAGLSPLWWGAPALLSALRRSVCDGRVWVYEGRVIKSEQKFLTLQLGEERVTLALTRPLPLKPGMDCRLCLERGADCCTLLDLSTGAPAKRRHKLDVCLSS